MLGGWGTDVVVLVSVPRQAANLMIWLVVKGKIV